MQQLVDPKNKCFLQGQAEGMAQPRAGSFTPLQHTYGQFSPCSFLSAPALRSTPYKTVFTAEFFPGQFPSDVSRVPKGWSVSYLWQLLRFTVIHTESFKQLCEVQLCFMETLKDSTAPISVTLWKYSHKNQRKLESPQVLLVSQDFCSGLKHIYAQLTLWYHSCVTLWGINWLISS